MYPDNYMNPMNNPMTNPNYGYNRMQQVQQMQRAINPQVPNMFGQVEQPQQMQSFISAVPVTCLIDDVIRQYGIKCIGFNRWDLYFVMNMLYSDYYNVLGSDTATYVKMNKAWFEDPDVSEGKAYRYYMQVAKA